MANFIQRLNQRRAARRARRDEGRRQDATESLKARGDMRHTHDVYDGTGERVDWPSSQR